MQTQIDERRGAARRWHPARDALFKLLRFLARHISGFHGPILALLIGGLIGAAGIIIFLLWARAVMRGATTAFDEAILSWFAARRTPMLDEIMLEITSLGNSVTVLVLVTIASVFLWLTRHRYSVYLLIIAVIGGSILNTLLKLAYNRPRPTVVEWVTDVKTQSFPSGHAMTAMIAYCTVAYLVGRLEPTPRFRRVTWLIAGIAAISIGVSRVYLGVHYPSDVLAGFVAGIAWLSIVISALTAMQYLVRRKPEVQAEEKDLQAERERAAGVRA